MNVQKFAEEAYERQSVLLHQALSLCSWEHRRELGDLLGHDGIYKSRFEEDEQWSESVGGIIFKLRMRGGYEYFHRLLVVCPVCAQEVPIGRLHQHSVRHVMTRLHPKEPAIVRKPTTSIWYRHWYVDADGFFRRTSTDIQYGFPQRPGGF